MVGQQIPYCFRDPMNIYYKQFTVLYINMGHSLEKLRIERNILGLLQIKMLISYLKGRCCCVWSANKTMMRLLRYLKNRIQLA